MRINTKVVWDMETLQVIDREGYEYTGAVTFCKASSQEEGIQKQTQDFFKQLTADYSSRFAGQDAIIGQLKSAYGELHSALTPILSGGVNQQGFSASELASFKTDATNRTSAEYQKAATAVGERMAAAGGGNTYLPKGVDAAVQASIAAQAAGQSASENLAIDEANYA